MAKREWGWASWVGLRRSYRQADRAVKPAIVFRQMAIGGAFVLHWLLVMPFAIGRMAVFPKRLKWVKTLRQDDYQA